MNYLCINKIFITINWILDTNFECSDDSGHIPPDRLCDGAFDCYDGSDETKEYANCKGMYTRQLDSV